MSKSCLLSACESFDQLVRAANVVLHRALLARVEAAPEREYEQDQDQQATADGYGPPHHERLAVRRRTARWPAARAAYGLVRFVEEGQENRS